MTSDDILRCVELSLWCVSERASEVLVGMMMTTGSSIVETLENSGECGETARYLQGENQTAETQAWQ